MWCHIINANPLAFFSLLLVCDHPDPGLRTFASLDGELLSNLQLQVSEGVKKGLSDARRLLMQKFSSGFDLVQNVDGGDDNEVSMPKWRALMRYAAHSLIALSLSCRSWWQDYGAH